MQKFLKNLCVAGAGAAAVMSAHAVAGPAEDLDALFDEYWVNELEENPFAATFAGVSEFNDRVPGVAPDDYARRLAEAEAFKARLAQIDLSAVDENDRLSARLLGFILKHDIALAEFRPWLKPFLAEGGFHSDVVYLVGATTFRTGSDYQDYLTRLAALPGYLDQNVANMRLGLAEGVSQPKEILFGVLPTFDALAVGGVEAHPLYAPFAEMPAAIPSKQQAALREKAREVIGDQVIPAYGRVAAFMNEEYAPNAADVVGIGDEPDGKAHYEALVRYYTTRDDATPEAIHKLGLKEVARIRKEMDAVIRKTGFDGDFRAFQEFLRTDEQFYVKTPEELLMHAAWIAKSIDGKLPGYFGKLPRQPYSVQPVPAAIAPNYTTGRYSPSPPDSDEGGEYWVNTYQLDKRPLYELPALTLHEAVPGHHLQGALSYEVEDAPAFRTQFYPHAFGEGWGLYAEKLGVEMGVYKTPYEEFGRLSYEMWRACRLVIDTGLHSKGWTRQQALDYLADNTALSLKNVQTEVDRYITWPGQALAYKMGELTFWEQRAKAEKALGEDFDLRDFHDAVLTKGGLPLEIVAEEVDAYIARTKAQ
ncbi:MAG: DUF885 domain-containing protein [Parvularculaceae bacterium]